MSEVLKACPFCGGDGRMVRLGWGFRVYCDSCGAVVTGRGYGDDGEADAVAAWNRRAPSKEDT